MAQIDLSYLNSVSGGDQAFVNEMLKMIMSNTFPEIEKLKKAQKLNRWGEISVIAHKIKAPIQMLGVPVLSDLITEIERHGKVLLNPELLAEKIPLLEILIIEITEEIEEILNK